MFQLAKNGTLFGLFRLSLSFLFACAAINWVNLAFRMTIIGDMHLTLATIPFKVEANNALIFLPLQQTYEKKFVELPFLLVYNSLCGLWLGVYRFLNLILWDFVRDTLLMHNLLLFIILFLLLFLLVFVCFVIIHMNLFVVVHNTCHTRIIYTANHPVPT